MIFKSSSGFVTWMPPSMVTPRAKKASGSMLPEAFFARGVTMLGGIQVTKPDELLNIISEGGSGYHFFGRYAERTVIRKKR